VTEDESGKETVAERATGRGLAQAVLQAPAHSFNGK
jgi:hypothetical protein